MLGRMDEKLTLFLLLSHQFKEKGYSLYLVGGTVRDYLLGRELTDMDLVTDATPFQMRSFITHADYTFEKYGSVKLNYSGKKFDITTLRKESSYRDSRHPLVVTFTKSLEEDVIRRDLTINALYMNDKFEVIDLVKGERDLKNKELRTIGDPLIRVIEDPLRIIRIARFKIDLDFHCNENLTNILKENGHLLQRLNKDKIKAEIRKSSKVPELLKYLEDLGIVIDL